MDLYGYIWIFIDIFNKTFQRKHCERLHAVMK